MEASESTIFPLLYISWGFITVVLVALLSYRATLLGKDDQTFADSATQDPREQELTLIARRSRLMGEIIVLSVMAGALLFTCVGLSI
jgi:hypothetical protein